MDASPILASLNEAQQQAVTAPLGAVLVLAGAGSGKTRVLTHRIAWLIHTQGVSPHSILAVTFTNKAAHEMRGRIEHLLGMPGGTMWLGTFHGIAHRLLRLHWREAGLPQGFQILDSEDQQRLVKRLIRAAELEDELTPRDVLSFINGAKDRGHRASEVPDSGDRLHEELVGLYRGYEAACTTGALVDFAELLLSAQELWDKSPEVLARYQRRFAHVLVDEFQDTNDTQYRWLRKLLGSTGHPFVVGDDDQAIYGWRGARAEHLQKLQHDFPQSRLYRLEQNYRSTGTILAGANGLIAHNSQRLGKNLWTDGSQGDPIHVYAAFNERDEADFVTQRIREWLKNGGRHRDIAILYRSNAQSRVFEESFISARIPYRIYGGLRFFERAEIKDALAYLRLLMNRHDDASFERVVNLPPRGVGAKSVDSLRARAGAAGTSMWDAALNGAHQLTGKAATGVRGFLSLIERLAQDTRQLPLHEQIDLVIQATGLRDHHEQDEDKGELRAENLDELVSAARGFAAEGSGSSEEMTALEAFLAHAVLESGEAGQGTSEDGVQMMTLHTAKGLEFPLVFLAGMEEGLFPHIRSATGIEGLEEERRLCYVGLTRAMQQLYITHAEIRRIHGNDNQGAPSRFIKEIPEKLIEEVRPKVHATRPVTAVRFRTEEADLPPGMRLGARVRHGKFGEGVILDIEGAGPHARVQVGFETEGTKWLVLQHAKLVAL
jgi:DNA helicase II / ATP-dependent DNA helicase PcrA